MKLAGKNAIITGGGSGFGEGIAECFSREGAKIVVADINFSQAERVAKKAKGVPVHVDVSKKASVENMVKEAMRELKEIDILVNNAGVTHLPAPMESVGEKEFDQILAVNAKSVYLTALFLVPHFVKRNTGTILNIASTAGVSPRPKLTWYNASKGWMITATKSMAIELAEHSIRVNAINPVAGETPLLKSFLGKDTPEIRAKFLNTIPLGRFSTPLDIGSAAVFLCSQEANMITGVTLEVDGGRCI
jgi:3-oxoacyl-[acyl-carrier protein] reductase